ncbi:MAG TPA: hypothetical protein VF101_14625 [Gaiellaceae bacterium]
MNGRIVAMSAAIVVAALSFAYGAGWPDVSRLALTQSLVYDGTLRIDRFARQTEDRADFAGHSYSDKAPGISFLAVPSLEAARAVGAVGRGEGTAGVWWNRWLLWSLRVLTGGLAFCVAVALAAVAARRVAPETTTAVAATVGLATMALPMAATVFSHLAAASLAFAAFLLAWRGGTRLIALAGAAAGAAVVFEYQAAVAAAVVLGYVVLRTRSVRDAATFLAGAVPFAVLLGAYNNAAFGSPLHFSYRYESATFPQQHSGFFGIGVPGGHALFETFLGRRGLFVVSPVLVLACAGLALLWRRGLRLEAAASGAIAAAFAVLAAGYFDPYGGLSPGPRYFAPALLFLALGLPEAYRRWPRTTTALAAISVAATLFQAGTWGPNFDWSTIWWWAGLPRLAGMALTTATVAGAAALVVPDLQELARRAPRRALAPARAH